VIGPLEERVAAQRRPLRFVAFGLAVLIGVTVLTSRLAYMQLANGGQYLQRPDANKVVAEAVPSTRGLIYDRSGRLLVTNIPSFAVKIRPGDLPVSQRAAVVTRLSALLGMSATDISTAIDSNPGSRFDLVRVANDVPEPTARLISEASADLPGVQVVVESHRQYLAGPLFSQILGYTGPVSADEIKDLSKQGYLPDDWLGKAGVEASYEAYLRGTYGSQNVERDASGRVVQVVSTVSNPEAGSSLQLTIDSREQKLAQQAIQWGIDTAHLESGVLIVMNPQTGEVLAMVSLPTYDNNLFATGISTADYQGLLKATGRPLVNHAIGDQYPPGSTYKLVTGTGGLADGKLTEHQTLLTKAYLSIGPYKYYDWNHAGWGPIDIKTGFGHSSDTFFYQVAGMLGIDRLAYWAHQYGFGAPTGIDLPGEAAGIVPSNQWKEDTFGVQIFPGETYQAGIGQGYDVATPIQLINAYCALANGGSLYQPQVVREVIGADGNVVRAFEPKLIHEMDVPADTLRIMREAARTVVTIRHTYNLVDLPIQVAGKSGTAEFGTRDAQGRLPFHSWFVGFTPRDAVNGSFSGTDSQLVVLAFANNSRTVGNAATEIVKYYLQLHYGINKDYRLPELLKRGNFYGD
jgi:penicillin-binding protein 2